MEKYPKCKRDDCEHRVQGVGLCALHYEQMLFGDIPEILGELEAMCANILCDRPIAQPRDALGNVTDRKLYCTACSSSAVRNGTQRIPFDDFFDEECDDCGRVFGRAYLNNNHHACRRCLNKREEEQRRRKYEYIKEYRKRKKVAGE